MSWEVLSLDVLAVHGAQWLCSHQSRQWGYELMKTTENHEEKEISELVKTIQ